MRHCDRGFSTSGSVLIIFTGLFIAVGGLYTATANTGERMADATDDQQEQFEDVQQSRIVTSADWNETTGNLTVRANNTGETTLSVDAVDVIVDGEYAPPGDFDRVEVEGRDTGIWGPDAQLVLEEGETFTSAPGRVKVVTGAGVADTATVEVVS